MQNLASQEDLAELHEPEVANQNWIGFFFNKGRDGILEQREGGTCQSWRLGNCPVTTTLAHRQAVATAQSEYVAMEKRNLFATG